MKITEELFDKISKLARLSIKPDQKLGLMNDMELILEWVGELNNVDTEGVEPLIYMSEAVDRTRKDLVEGELSQKEALLNAPDHDDSFFKVPQVIQRPNE